MPGLEQLSWRCQRGGRQQNHQYRVKGAAEAHELPCSCTSTLEEPPRACSPTSCPGRPGLNFEQHCGGKTSCHELSPNFIALPSQSHQLR